MAESRYNAEGRQSIISGDRTSSLLKKRVSIMTTGDKEVESSPPKLDKSVLERMASTFYERVKETGKLCNRSL